MPQMELIAMKTFSTPRVLAVVALASIAGSMLAVPIDDAEARKGRSASVRDHRAPAPVFRARRVPGANGMKSRSGVKGAPNVGTAKRLTCVGSFCPRVRSPAPKATTTGTNKVNPKPPHAQHREDPRSLQARTATRRATADIVGTISTRGSAFDCRDANRARHAGLARVATGSEHHLVLADEGVRGWNSSRSNRATAQQVNIDRTLP
jgi:hypothetical protein